MLTYLALGDSYTIGEQVLLTESFPYQTIRLLRDARVEVCAPEIIAKTGWTTDELLSAIKNYRFAGGYDIVSLLIGVNNQYRGRTEEEFEIELNILIEKAVEHARGTVENVFVLSIPDWGVTPFADGRDRTRIAGEIDSFNVVCKNTAEKCGCVYLENTLLQSNESAAEMLAADGLHPSGKEYRKWAEKFAKAIISRRSVESVQ